MDHRSWRSSDRLGASSARGALHRTALALGPAVLRGLDDLARSTGTTVEIVALALARWLTSLYTGQDEIVFGNAIVPRDNRESFTAFLSAVGRAQATAGDPAGDPAEVAAGVTGPSPQLEIMLQVVRDPDELRLDVHHDPERFDEGTVARMAGVCAHLARQVAARPSSPIRELELVPEDQRAELLERFNDSSFDEGDAGAAVDDLFDDAVRRFPDRPAVAFQGSSLTYAELDRRVRALARRLVRMGVRAGEPVALQLPPSLQTPIAMLAALRAGACYLPLDPALPAERARFLLADSGARILIADPQATGAHAFDGQLVELGADGDPLGDPAAELPRPRATDAAYLIYTSGTTGHPKGVGVDHTHTAAILTSCAFDLAYTTLWTTLLSGGCVHFLPRATCEDPAAVARYLRDHRVTFIKVTPSLLGALVASKALDRDACATLRLIVTGGEPVRPADIEALYARCPGVLVVNHYGPTETTIGVTTYPVERARLAGFARRPVIGAPIGNTRAYVATPSLQLLPLGAPGELIIAGCGVARGYLGRDELTRERFIPDPFGAPGAAYRTGDLARWTPDGTLELLGRIDRQVKIRGYRVELAEIEQVMIRRLGMAEAAVLLRPGGASSPILCAYHVGGPRLAPTELRASLLEVLPEYMVPACFIELPALPRTANGKLDAARLPAPHGAGHLASPAPASQPEDLPRTETERILQHLWAGVLGLDAAALGVSQSFFELGGHSLLMIQLIAEIDDRFGRTVPIPAFYREGTIRALAQILDADTGTGADATASADATADADAGANASADPGPEPRPAPPGGAA
jgi:surfactin family lipopeptide synthetase B